MARVRRIKEPGSSQSRTHPDTRSGKRAGAIPIQLRRHAFVTSLERGLQLCGVVWEPQSDPLPLVIGVSGGAGSVALLLGSVAISRRKTGCLKPIAVHVHHHLRDSADDDASWVAELCDAYNVELHLEHVYPGRLKGNVSANARRLRYEAIQSVAKRSGTAFVAVAHHADDQLETMIAALCRGSGIDGLAGMFRRRELHDGVYLIRPLLNVRRSDCESFCRALGISWRDDPSNTDPDRVRARLRHDVTPVLEELWPDAATRASATADLLQAIREQFDQTLNQIFPIESTDGWDRTTVATQPEPLIAAGLRKAAMHLAPACADRLAQRELVQAARAIRSKQKHPRRFHWPGGLTLTITSRGIQMTVDQISDRSSGENRHG